MGFHAVATGYIIKHHGTTLDMLRFIAKSILYDGKKYTSENYETFLENKYEFNDDYILLDDNVKIEFYPDINCKYKTEQLTYSNNKNIYVGEAHGCALMIYISCVGDDLGGGDNTFIDDSTLLDLITWKNELVKQGRLDRNVKFCSIGNCCS